MTIFDVHYSKHLCTLRLQLQTQLRRSYGDGNEGGSDHGFISQKKAKKMSLQIDFAGSVWRRERDSNPREIALKRISSPFGYLEVSER